MISQFAWDFCRKPKVPSRYLGSTFIAHRLRRRDYFFKPARMSLTLLPCSPQRPSRSIRPSPGSEHVSCLSALTRCSGTVVWNDECMSVPFAR